MLTKHKQLSAKLEEAKKAADNLQASRILLELGMLCTSINDYTNAIGHLRSAESYLRDTPHQRLLAQVLNQAGVVQLLACQPHEAQRALQEALAISRDVEDYQLTAAISGNMGRVYTALGDYPQAVRCYKMVLDISLEKQDQNLQLQSLIHLSDTYLRENSLQQALGFALVGYDLGQNLTSHAGLMIITDLLGMIYARRREFTSAIDYFQQAASLAEENGDLPRLASALANQALALEALTRMEEAELCMEKALEIFSEIDSESARKTIRDLARIRSSKPK